MNAEEIKLLIEIFGFYIILILIGIGYIVTYLFGSRKMPIIRDKILNALKPTLKGRVSKLKIIEHSEDSIELKCEPKKQGILAFSIFIMLWNRKMFHSWLISKLMKEKDSLVFAAKFGVPGNVMPPDHELYIVPYRNKFVIKKKFEEFVKIDDIQTKSKFFNEHYMIKSTDLAKTRGLLNDKKFHEMMKNLEPYITYIFIAPPETSKDPHIQYEFDFVEDPLILKQLTDVFFYIVDYYTALRGYKAIKKKKSNK